MQVELEFLPWLTQQAITHIQQEAVARAVLQQMVADAVQAQASTLCAKLMHGCFADSTACLPCLGRVVARLSQSSDGTLQPWQLCLWL